MKPAELMIMACTDKSGQRVWAVQSTSQTKANGFPTFHLVTWDVSKAAWSCPCQSRKPCIHMRFASEASRIEQQRVDAAFDALTAKEAVQKTQPQYTDIIGWYKCSTHGCINDYKHECPECSEYIPGGLGGFWTNGAKYCDRCYREKCTHQTEPQYPDYDDSNPHRDELEVLMKAEPIIARNDTGPRLFRETPKAIEHLLIGGWDGVVNGRDERLLEAYDKSSHVLVERKREVM